MTYNSLVCLPASSIAWALLTSVQLRLFIDNSENTGIEIKQPLVIDSHEPKMNANSLNRQETKLLNTRKLSHKSLHVSRQDVEEYEND